MSSKKKQPKCMDMNNYVNVKKITKNLFNNNSCSQYRIYINGCNREDCASLDEVNDYINRLKKTNPLALGNVEVEQFRFLNATDITRNPSHNLYQEYVYDVIHYIKLFLFRKIKVMSVVNLIIYGGYFECCEYDNIMSLKELITYVYDADIDDLEDYYRNFNIYQPIQNTFCYNFKELQYLE